MKMRKLRLEVLILSSSMLAEIITLNVPAACAQIRKQATGPATPAAEKAKFKGFLEPVSYKQDVKLTDAFFTTIDEGWVSGEHATILHTDDGGKNWTAQVGGDPANNEHPIRDLRFLNAKLGWAIQDGPERLLQTTDGQNWQELGPTPRGVKDFMLRRTATASCWRMAASNTIGAACS